ncbi:hypothetical protein VTI74DRAFT_6614 [Chaetomium olivicolor]
MSDCWIVVIIIKPCPEEAGSEGRRQPGNNSQSPKASPATCISHSLRLPRLRILLPHLQLPHHPSHTQPPPSPPPTRAVSYSASNGDASWQSPCTRQKKSKISARPRGALSRYMSRYIRRASYTTIRFLPGQRHAERRGGGWCCLISGRLGVLEQRFHGRSARLSGRERRTSFRAIGFRWRGSSPGIHRNTAQA